MRQRYRKIAPLTRISGNGKRTLHFDCKPGEINGVRKIRHQAKAIAMKFHKSRQP
jgi:hypothetical protein